MTSASYDVVVIVHRVFVNGARKPGGLDIVVDLLKQRGWRVAMVEHPLDARGPSRLCSDDGTSERIVVRGLGWCRWELIRWVLEPAWTLWVVTRHCATHADTVAIAADPLNALAGLALRRLRVVRAVGFHVADFSTQRFASRWLDRLYLALYRFAAGRANVTTAVSQRIVEYTRGLRGVEPSTILRFPNSPVMALVPYRPPAVRRPATCVMAAGTLSPWVGTDVMLDAVRLARRAVPDLHLRIIGGFRNDDESRRLAAEIHQRHLEAAVTCTGFLARGDAMALMAESSLGLAWYVARESTWNYYGDSLKIWEYAACGLPVIANRLVGNAKELSEAGGARLADDAETAAEALVTLCRDPALYTRMAEASRQWAKAHDKVELVDRLAARLREGQTA